MILQYLTDNLTSLTAYQSLFLLIIQQNILYPVEFFFQAVIFFKADNRLLFN